MIGEVRAIPDFMVSGVVTAVKGLLVEAKGIEKMAYIGSRCQIEARDDHHILAEVIGFEENTTLLMPFDNINGIGVGAVIRVIANDQLIYPTKQWVGRVLNAFGEPIDGKGPLPLGNKAYSLHSTPPAPQARKRVGEKLNVGIRAINTFLSCCKGQRMGIFSGSGVGKSMMMAMMTKFASADIKIIGLIGERGREVQEFIEDYLGEEGLRKAVVVVATSDESALKRRRAAYLTLTLSEYFRDSNLEVLCMLDNITRFAMAQREIGLAVGEPPTTKGYPPSVFSGLPSLLERAGPGTHDQASITAFFSVLVEGDDTNEPIADAVRGILDGHIVLDRDIAGRGIFPAIDVAKSISRTMPRCNNDKENELIQKAKKLIATYNDMADMVRIGAYKKGTDKEVDEAIQYYDKICSFISQKYNESEDIKGSYEKLAKAINFKFNN
ncbi:MAG: flagellar protein export ATPase FliI [Candidatus Midichloria mitochondrii]|nr:flagellar protein export ATPase FliI [Candidatus Midichloria mitochondrii]